MSLPRFFIASLVSIVALSGCGGDQSASTEAADSKPVTFDQLMATADIERGKTMYFQCRACHSLDPGGPHKVGPNLYGVFDRKAGLAEGFAYSDVLVNSDVIWTPEVMDEWLVRPSEMIPGNRMVFVGIKDARDRANLIAFMQQEIAAQ